jgi:hypothetical protein
MCLLCSHELTESLRPINVYVETEEVKFHCKKTEQCNLHAQQPTIEQQCLIPDLQALACHTENMLRKRVHGRRRRRAVSPHPPLWPFHLW